MVLKTLRILSKKHKIKYAVVLPYPIEIKKELAEYEDYETIFPELLERVPRRYGIDKRNRWMISQSDVVITYVNTCIGGAAKYAEICEKKHLEVIKLGKV